MELVVDNGTNMDSTFHYITYDGNIFTKIIEPLIYKTMQNKENPIPKDLFQDVPVEQRAQMLDDQAYKVEKMSLKRPFETAELSHFKDEISTKMINLSDKEEELADIKAKYKAEMKPEKDAVRKLLKNVRLGYEEYDDKVYQLANQTSGEMEYYTSDGKFVESRRLMPSERQGNVFQMKAAQ